MKWLRRLLLGLVLLLVMAYGVLQTAPAKNWLAGFIGAQLSTPMQQVQITRLRGHIPWDINIAQLKVKKGDEDVLIADKIALDWRLLRLAKGQVVINSLSVEKISWLKPFVKSTSQTSNDSLLSFPELAIGKIVIPEIMIAKGLAGKEELELEVAVNGDKNRMMHFNGQMLVKKGINTELLFNFVPNSATSFLLDIALNEDAGGLVGSLLKLPKQQAIHMKALLKGDLQSLGGSFNLSLGDELLADLTINTNYANHVQIAGRGALPAFVQLPSFVEGREWTLNAGIMRAADLWQIEGLNLQLANFALELTGQVGGDKAQFKPHLTAIIDEQKYEAVGEVAFDFATQTLNANMAGELQKLPLQLQKMLGESATLAWTAKTQGELSNIPQKLTLEAQIKAFNLETSEQLAHLKLGDEATINASLKQLQIKAELLAGELSAKAQANIAKNIIVNVEVTHQTLPTIKADAEIASQMIKNFNIDIAQTSLKGKDLRFKPQSGELTLTSDDVASLVEWAGLMQAKGRMNANIVLADDIANINANVAASDLMIPQYDLRIDTLNSNLAQGIFALTIDGQHAGEKIALDMAGNYVKNKSNNIAHLITLTGEYGAHSFKLNDETKLTWQNAKNWAENWQVPATTIEIASAKLNPTMLKLRGTQTDDKVDIVLELPNLALRPLLINRIPTMGEADLSAQMNVTGKPSNPKATFNVVLVAGEMTKIAKDNADSEQLKLQLNGKYAEQSFNANAQLTSGVEQLGSGKIALPLEFSLKPFMFRLKPSPMQATAHLEVAMSRFNSWISPFGHRIKANLLADLSANGQMDNLKTKASIAFKDLNYTNLQSGVCLRHGEMQAKITPEKQVILQSFKAYGDRDRGEIKATGAADFARDIINFEMKTKDAAIFCSPMLDGAITGDLKLAGSSKALQLTGDMKLGKTSILIPSGGKTAIPKVEKVYRYQLYQNAQTKPQISPLNLDLTIDAPKQIFVRGRGLDAEFGGNFHILGNSNAPKIEGKLASKRGRLALLGSTMQINEGVLRFMNGEPQKPYIQLQGATRTNNTQINVELEGAVLKPKLTLSSTPSLPQDEILALLLFGKPLQQISPFQALQLAQAAASLASGESGTGMLGSAREVLGVDSLNVGEGADGSPTIGAGKYVTDKVFVGIEQGTTPESRRISTEIELSPTITGKTSTNTQGEPTLGLEWRYDY